MGAERPGGLKERPRSRLGLVLAVALPALFAGSLAFLFLPTAEPTAPVAQVGTGDAVQLASVADRAGTLKPIVMSGDGGARLGSGPAGPSAANPRPAAPRRISIPAVDVNAAVEPVARTATGIAVPAVGRAGWYREGPRPGEPGRSVVIGHLDSANGPGLFALLPGVANGTEVTMIDARGVRHRYAVVGKAQVEKWKFPAQAVYGPSDKPVLVLVTCGGPYTPQSGYRDNVIVYARSI